MNKLFKKFINKKNKLIIFLLMIILVLFIFYKCSIKENFNNEMQLFQELMDKHYTHIFPNNANRNSAGFRFFEYIYDNLATSEELFDKYNKMYCPVSGSIVSPNNPNNYSILKVKNENNKCVYGKYYRCCVPCNCDIMKYTTVIETNIEIPKNSNKFYKKLLLTINDPCVNPTKLPQEVDKNIFKCKNKLLNYGYRLDNNNKLTKKNGKLVIGVLYPASESEISNKLNESVQGCLSGTKRFLSNPDELQYGMGDIFVKLALINDKNKYTHTIDDFCKN